MTKHVPVLLEEVRKGLHLTNGMVAVDATLGGGGHASMMLQSVLPEGSVIALDADRVALQQFEKRIITDSVLEQASKEGRLVVKQSNYSAMGVVLDELGITTVDAILADLGFSSDQIEEAERGFSFRESGPLDMRLDQEQLLTAALIVNQYEEADLARIFREYGDESEARNIARAIVARRRENPFQTTAELRLLIEEVYPKKLRYASRIHPATKVFQALRIVVNRELENLLIFLDQSLKRLASGGRLAVITFHSGEDKLVKAFLKEAATGCVCPPNFPVCRCEQVPRIRILNKKPIIPSEQEVQSNPRARSAKLRVIEKL